MMENQEIWKDIKDYEGLYQVSELGVKRIDKQIGGRTLKPMINIDGYPVVDLSNGNVARFRIHRLIAIAFIPNPYNKPEVNHINGIKTDFRIINLEWCTTSENAKHAFKIGLRTASSLGKFGKYNHKSKIVYQYSRVGLFIAKYEGLMDAQRKTGINNSCISMVCRGKRNHAGGFIWRFNKL